MNLHSTTKQLVSLLAVTIMVSCDKDFNEIGTEIVGGDNEHYDLEKNTDYSIKAYNQKIGAVASHNLPVNPLGFFHNPVFGTTTANFVTQLEIADASLNRTFNNVNSELYQDLPVIDSVILNVPYFSRLKETNENGSKTYRLDSIYGTNNSKFRLNIYQSNYFLRNLDPDSQFVEEQSFYNDNESIENFKILGRLNNAPLTNTDEVKNADGHQNEQFFFNNEEIITTVKDEDGEKTITRSVPAMRLHLEKTVFYNKIINAPSGQLANNNTFKDYFRGLYFNVENLGNSNNMAMINFAGGSVTIYYKEDAKKTDSDETVTFNRVSKTFVMNLSGNRVSLQKNSNETPSYLAATANPLQEASSLYLKGGQGAMAIIDLFEGNQLEEIKANNWLINEANLTFYIETNKMQDLQAVEPNRILLYDLNNNRVLTDYLYDQTTYSPDKKQDKYIHGGFLLDSDEKHVAQAKNDNGQITKKGTKYKIRITDHIKNLVKKDSTNVRLGLVVTENINNVGFSKLKTPIGNIKSVPTMSVTSPVGTVLYGSHQSVTDDKRLKLEIYYTKPK